MTDSYKVRTYPTLHPWIPLHQEIIEHYEQCPNKAEFVKMALEHFAESGFPGLKTETTVVHSKAGPGKQALPHEAKDAIQQMEEELGDLC